MYSADNTVHHLLWCILVALRTADQEKTFTSEMARRRFIANWLDTARGNPSFRGMNAEFTTLRQLLETSDKGVPVDSTLSVLLSHASAVEQCDLFRFRSALNILMQKGWHLVICRFPENITTELMQRRQGRRKHALQLTCTENAFQPAGNMVQPITFQLLLNRTTENSEDAEMIFHTEGFQGVVANEMELDNRRIIRTLHIGTPSIPAGEWSPSKDNIWQ
ncbi:hypothetical protein ABF224_003363, partial [Yersinia ruckeri]